MLNRIRRFAAAFATAGLALTLALPARADRVAETGGDEPNTVPVVFDVAVMRPLGLLTCVVGAAFYLVPVAPIVALTRPTEIAKPLGPLVGGPLAFTFKDPLGHHPRRWLMNKS
jgi:hypothetical protein